MADGGAAFDAAPVMIDGEGADGEPVVGAPALGAAAGPARSDDVWAAAAGLGDQDKDHLDRLEQRRREMLAERELLNREIHNAQRKRVRMMERARGLTDQDLLSIIASRATAKSKAAAKTSAKAKAAA